MAPRLTAARRCCKDGPHVYTALLSSCRRTGRALLRLQDWTWCYRDGAYIQWDWAQSTGQGPWNTCMQPHAVSRSRMQLRMRDGQGAAAAWAMNRLRRLALPPSPGWAPPLPSWRGVGSAQPARLPLFPSPAVADQAPGVAGAEQLRAREALQPDTLGPIFALGPGGVYLAPLGRGPCQLVEEGRGRIWRHGWLSRTGCRGRGLCLNGKF